MIRKITLLTSFLLSVFAINSAVAQEGGAPEKTVEDVIEVVQDSALVYQEAIENETLSEPITSPFNIPFSSLKKDSPILEKESNLKLNEEGENITKEPKQEFSFNIIYYLIYKFKQVDNQ